MNDMTLMILWATLGLIAFAVTSIATYQNARLSHLAIRAEIEKAERELANAIERIGVAELVKTQAGMELITLRRAESHQQSKGVEPAVPGGRTRHKSRARQR